MTIINYEETLRKTREYLETLAAESDQYRENLGDAEKVRKFFVAHGGESLKVEAAILASAVAAEEDDTEEAIQRIEDNVNKEVADVLRASMMPTSKLVYSENWAAMVMALTILCYYGRELDDNFEWEEITEVINALANLVSDIK